MNVLGSFFLGDPQNMRLRGSSTSPPTSPNSSRFGTVQSFHVDQALPTATTVSPELSLELRIRHLEALVNGVDHTDQKENREKDGVSADKHGPTVARQVEEIQAKLEAIMTENETLKLFSQYFKSHAQHLTPEFALNDLAAARSTTMMPSEFEALLKDMEPDIIKAERDLREIDEYERRGITAAGDLGVHEELQTRLNALIAAHTADAAAAVGIEKRIATLLQRYTVRTDALSELFVEWNSVITAVEEKVRNMERYKKQRGRLGYE